MWIFGKKKSHNQRLGEKGEALARSHLQAQGFRVVAERFRTRYGEIDLVATRDSHLYFVEVKYRRSADFGHAVESVHAAKQAHLRKAALIFLQRHPQYQKDYDLSFLALAIMRSQEREFVEMVEF